VALFVFGDVQEKLEERDVVLGEDLFEAADLVVAAAAGVVVEISVRVFLDQTVSMSG
jgi:hypothetical protein